jgi:hypothetical protein
MFGDHLCRFGVCGSIAAAGAIVVATAMFVLPLHKRHSVLRIWPKDAFFWGSEPINYSGEGL